MFYYTFLRNIKIGVDLSQVRRRADALKKKFFLIYKKVLKEIMNKTIPIISTDGLLSTYLNLEFLAPNALNS